MSAYTAEVSRLRCGSDVWGGHVSRRPLMLNDGGLPAPNAASVTTDMRGEPVDGRY